MSQGLGGHAEFALESIADNKHKPFFGIETNGSERDPNSLKGCARRANKGHSMAKTHEMPVVQKAQAPLFGENNSFEGRIFDVFDCAQGDRPAHRRAKPAFSGIAESFGHFSVKERIEPIVSKRRFDKQGLQPDIWARWTCVGMDGAGLSGVRTCTGLRMPVARSGRRTQCARGKANAV